MDARRRFRTIIPLIALFVSMLGLLVPHEAAAGVDAGRAPRPVWISTFGVTPPQSDLAHDVATSPDGAMVFVTGGVNGSASMTTVAYDAATGTQLWVASYDGPEGNGALGNAIAAGPDGALVFVTGYVTRSLGNTDFVTVAYDAATGAQQWASLYDGPGHGDDSANAIDVSRRTGAGWSSPG